MSTKSKLSRNQTFNIILYIFFFLMCACFVLPLIVVISASFTSEQALTSGGFSLLPRDFTLDAYKSAFSSGTRVLRAYGVTIFQAVVGTVLSSLVAALAAYPLSRSNFRYRRPITVFIFFTMLFSAGMIPNYIIFAKYYKLADSIWIYILPGITGGAWNTMVFRTFFKGLPETLFEAAYLDGASELRIFFSVVLPLSTPVFASLGFMALVARWNDYTTSMIYIRNESLYTLQYLLQRMMDQAEFMKNLANNPMMSGSVSLDTSMLPSESLKFAMCVIAAGPMLVVFPFFQKYFAQGLTIGAVIDTGAPNGVAFQRILLHNIALFREQLPDCVDLLCHSVCGCQFLQRRVHYAASDLQEKRLIAAANFHAQLLHQRTHQQRLDAE